MQLAHKYIIQSAAISAGAEKINCVCSGGANKKECAPGKLPDGGDTNLNPCQPLGAKFVIILHQRRRYFCNNAIGQLIIDAGG
jgi:hypothetical protein